MNLSSLDARSGRPSRPPSFEKEAKGFGQLICLAGVESLNNRLGELPEVVEVTAADLIDDVPIDGVIAVNCNVSESDRFCHTVSQGRGDDLKVLERVEVLRHGGRRRGVGFSNQMRGKIDGKLDGTLKIQSNNILQVGVLCQLIGGRRCFSRDSLDATAEGFELGFD